MLSGSVGGNSRLANGGLPDSGVAGHALPEADHGRAHEALHSWQCAALLCDEDSGRLCVRKSYALSLNRSVHVRLSSCAANDVVPLLRETFARVLPVLASVKQDNMKWVFASGIGYFCDAILAYSANHAGKEGALTASSFSSEVFPAFEVMFNSWLDSKEVRVRLAVVQAIGNTCALMSRDTFDTHLPRILPVVLKMFAREKEHLSLAQGLCVILEAAVKVQWCFQCCVLIPLR